jgi:hypothetical protein
MRYRILKHKDDTHSAEAIVAGMWTQISNWSTLAEAQEAIDKYRVKRNRFEPLVVWEGGEE